MKRKVYFVFDQIGQRIMNWMKWVCIIGWIYVAIKLISEWVTISDAGWQWLETKYGTDERFWCSVLAFINALLTAGGVYVATWVLYGFGQLVDDVHHMRTKGGQTAVTVSVDGEKKTVVTTEKTESSSFGANWKCSKCGTENPVFKAACKKCGADKYSRPGQASSSGPKWRCPKCGEENPTSRASCKSCGAYK